MVELYQKVVEGLHMEQYMEHYQRQVDQVILLMDGLQQQVVVAKYHQEQRWELLM